MVDRLYGIQDDAARLKVAQKRRHLKRWATTSPAVACLHVPDVLAHKGALHFAHEQLARDNDAPLRQTHSQHQADAHAPTDSTAETLTLLALVIHELLLGVCPPPPDALHLARRLRQTRLHVRVHSLRPATPISSLKNVPISKWADSTLRRNSTFCLAPRGDTPSSRRVYDAIAAGCIPVLITDEALLRGGLG